MNYEALLLMLLGITALLLIVCAFQDNLRAGIGCGTIMILIAFAAKHEAVKKRHEETKRKEEYHSEIKKQMVKITVEKGGLQQKFLTCLELDMPLETCIYKTIKKEEK